MSDMNLATSHTLDTPTKICITPEKSKAGADESTSEQADSKSSPKLNVDEKLKKTLEEHGISRSNADSFLLGLLRNRDFKNFVKNNADSSDEEASVPAVPMTRAKLKEAMRNSPFKTPSDVATTKVQPKFTEIPLPDNDDEDEEYEPDLIDLSFGSDTRDICLAEGEQNEVDISKHTDEDENQEPQVHDVLPSKDALDATPLDMPDRGNGDNNDIISKRTRSKHSLQSTSLDVLEAAFDPPDATADMYDTSFGDYDWHKWLSDLMKDDAGKDNATEEDDNPDDDPDFDFTPELDKPDEEDMRDDHSVQVSKKELHGLLDEIENMQNDNWPPVTLVAEPPTHDTLQPASLKKRAKTKPRRKSNHGPIQLDIPPLQMSPSQIELLKQQLQQHVQFLTQENILCRNNVELQDFVVESKELLLELKQVGESQKCCLGIQESFVVSWSLQEAINLTEIDIAPSEPSVRLLVKEVSKGHASIPKSVAEVIANSQVFMYKELLPLSAPTSKNSSQKNPFRHAEDNLVALGLAEMDGMENNFELISQHMLPTKTDKQIQVRIRNVLSCRNLKDTVNPIRNFHVCGSLPKPRTDIKFVHEQTAKRPIDMKGTLPCWVLALKPIYIPGELSDDSLSDLGQPHVQSTPCNNSAAQQAIMSPYKPVMIPYSVIQAVPGNAVSGPLHLYQPIQNTVVVSEPLSPFPVQSLNIPVVNTVPNVCRGTPLQSTIVTSTSTKPITTAKIQTNPKYGRRKSAGKSIERLSKCEGLAVVSLSSSSSSEDEIEPVVNNDIPKFPVDEDCNIQTEKPQIIVESDDEDQSDHENHGTNKAVEMEIQTSSKNSGSKAEEEPSFLPMGGYLKKMHPKLSSRKGKPGSRDLRKARSTAKMVRSLEEDTIVQLDPKRIEKENIFAMGYHERVEKTLKDHPVTYKKFLETLEKYSDGTRSPVDLHSELSALLHDWPELVQGFAPFLMSEQARECGLSAEQEVYAKARKFLRQLEIQFTNRSDHMEKILNVFHTVAETAIYREEEMLKSILILLKDYPYLQDEFLTFFDDQHPPKVLFDEDFEEVDLTEELMKDPMLNQFEQVNLPLEIEGPDLIPPHENIIKRARKRKASLGCQEECKSPEKAINLVENKENISPETVNSDVDEGEEAANTDYESEDALMEDVAEEQETNTLTASIPPDFAVISEDALSSSPFKRITEEAALRSVEEPLRPDTPTGLRLDNTYSMTISASPLPRPKSLSNELPVVPATPGKILPNKETLAEEFRDKHSETSIQRVTGNARSAATEDPTQAAEQAPPATSESVPTPDRSPACQSGKEGTLQVSELVAQSATAEKAVPQSEIGVPTAAEKYASPSPCKSGEICDVTWTREADELILTSCQQGITNCMFAALAANLHRTTSQVEGRLNQLLRLFDENDDAISQESEEDTEIYSDSSTA